MDCEPYPITAQPNAATLPRPISNKKRAGACERIPCPRTNVCNKLPYEHTRARVDSDAGSYYHASALIAKALAREAGGFVNRRYRTSIGTDGRDHAPDWTRHFASLLDVPVGEVAAYGRSLIVATS